MAIRGSGYDKNALWYNKSYIGTRRKWKNNLGSEEASHDCFQTMQNVVFD